MSQGAFVLDLDRCTGCSACSIACSNENPVTGGISWRTVYTSNPQRLPGHPVFHYSFACNHCLKPACLQGCPAQAYTKDAETGAVVLEKARCMGCGYCTWVCPYDAPRLNPTGVMEKCTFCNHRLTDDLEPMCVGACPTDALRFEVDAEPTPIVRPGFPKIGLKPAISVLESRRHDAPTTTFSNNVAIPIPVSAQARLSWGGFASESTLWFFTSVAAALVAWFTASVVQKDLPIFSVFAVAGGLGMAVSALHLGRPGRMWRSFLGFSTSWISREIVTFTFFFGGACAVMLKAGPWWVSWVVIASGVAALVSMDMVYRIRGSRIRAVPHSAMTTLTAVLYVSLLLGSPVVVAVAVVKTALYLAPRRPHNGVLWVLVRLALLVSPVVSVMLLEPPVLAMAAVVALGELLDRAELYAGLCFVDPQRQLDDDFNTAASSSAG